MIPIVKTDALKTWNLGKLEGTPQDKEAVDKLDKQLINSPDKPVEGGESFVEFSTRILGKIKELIASAPDNTIVVTHNSAFGLIKLWDKKGRPKHLDRPFRTEYTKQDSETGASFHIKGEHGTLHICRHGETTDNVKKVFRTDEAELTDEGVKEAEKLGEEHKDTKIPEIVCSSLDRTVETSHIIADAQEGEKEPEEVEPKDEEVTEDVENEEREEEEESKGLTRSVFLYMEPKKGDDKRNFASCGSCCMFLAKHNICSLHGKDVKVDADDSCGLYSRGGPAPETEMEHVHKATTPEESGLTEGPVQCKNCHYYDKADKDCLLFRLVGIKEYKVNPDACCNAFSPKHKVKEEKEEEKEE